MHDIHFVQRAKYFARSTNFFSVRAKIPGKDYLTVPLKVTATSSFLPFHAQAKYKYFLCMNQSFKTYLFIFGIMLITEIT